jgi:hypothetical protein
LPILEFEKCGRRHCCPRYFTGWHLRTLVDLI